MKDKLIAELRRKCDEQRAIHPEYGDACLINLTIAEMDEIISRYEGDEPGSPRPLPMDRNYMISIIHNAKKKQESVGYLADMILDGLCSSAADNTADIVGELKKVRKEVVDYFEGYPADKIDAIIAKYGQAK